MSETVANKGLVWLRRVNIWLCAVGLAVFGALWVQVTFFPEALMEKAQDYGVMRAEAAVEEQFERLAEVSEESALGPLAQRALEKAREAAGDRAPDAVSRLEGLRASLDTPEAAELRKDFVEGVLKLAGRLEPGTRIEIDGEPPNTENVDRLAGLLQAGMAQGMETARERVVNRFDGVMADLQRDLSIFSGTTAFAFGFALVLSVLKGARVAPMLLPVSASLSLATVMAAWWYAFGQNWAMVLLTNDFMGWGYAVLLGVLLLIMLDIAVNRARVMRAIFGVFDATISTATPL